MRYQSRKYDPTNREATASLYIIFGVGLAAIFLTLYFFDVVSTKKDSLSGADQTVREWIYDRMEDAN